MNLAMADAAICAWDTKYEYTTWRPITAIRLADTDGNALTVADTGWEPLLTTPNFPGYVSGDSLFSSAGAEGLAALTGSDNFSFTSVADNNPSLIRSYVRFSDAATEAGMSRTYGGIHFGFDNTVAGSMGRMLVGFVSQTQLLAVAAPENRSVSLLMCVGAWAVVVVARRKRGQNNPLTSGNGRVSG